MSKSGRFFHTISAYENSNSRSSSPTISPYKHIRKTSTPINIKGSSFSSSKSKDKPSNFPILSKMKSRTSRTQSNVNPEIAAQVIKEYLLPMFNSDNRNRQRERRKKDFGLRDELKPNKTFSELEGTVYAELNLSSQLNEEMKNLRSKTKDLQSTINDLTQEKEAFKKDNEILAGNYLMSNTNIKALQTQYLVLQNEFFQLESSLSFIKGQLSEYNQKYDQCFQEKEKLNKELHEERANNDKLKNLAIQLEHGTALLVLENQIMGERLKGLFQAFEKLSGNQSMSEKLNNEVEMMRSGIHSLANFDISLGENLREAIEGRDSLLKTCEELRLTKDDLKSQRDKLMKNFKENTAEIQRDLVNAKQDREKYFLEAATFEKKFTDLNQEYNRVRARLKGFQHANSEYEEKTCKNCSKPFFEKDNFNWTCRVHPSKITEDT